MLERPISKAGWTRVRFDQIATQINDRVDNPAEAGVERYVGLEHLDPDSLRIRRWGEPSDVESTKLRFQPGDIIFGKRRVYQRKVAVADFEGICSAHAMVLRAKPGAVLPEFLPYFMQSDLFMERALSISVGSLSPTINWKALAAEEFLLPPIQEQARLVDMFSAFWATIENYAESLAASDRLRDALIAHTIHFGDGDCVTRQTDVGTFPSHWDLSPLGDRYSVQLGKMMSPAAIEGEMQIPYMRNANVQWNRLDLSDVATMSFNEKERQKFSLKTGDILACEGRHVGKSVIWRNEIPGACYQKALHRLRPIDPRNDKPEWMLNCLRYYSVAGKLVGRTAETTIPHLPAERLREIVFPFPPSDEQERLTGKVAMLDQKIAEIQRRLEGLHDSLRQQTSAAIGGMV